MLSEERYRYIENMIHTHGSVSTLDIARVFDVSTETIRRDLAQLEERGILERVYGGAIDRRRSRTVEPSYRSRSTINPRGKTKIADVAKNQLRTGQTVFVDGGTTCHCIAQALTHGFSGTVVTPSILAVTELAEVETVDVIVAPGTVRPGDWSVTGTLTQEFLNGMHVDVAFIAAGGFDSHTGPTDFSLDDASYKRGVIKHADVSYVVADRTKEGAVARFTIAAWDQLDGIITDSEPSLRVRESLDHAKVKIFLP